MRPLRVLDFDIENRPLSYLGQDFTTSDVTAIAAGWVGGPGVMCWLLGQHTAKEMLLGFRAAYVQADIVTGHYIRKHDLPIINGALIELGLPSLPPKLTCDTKLDLIRFYGISKAQENLAQMLGLAEEKTHMSNASWREANRLTDRGLAKTKARCVGDVKQHMAMREQLVKRGLLNRPKTWRP